MNSAYIWCENKSEDCYEKICTIFQLYCQSKNPKTSLALKARVGRMGRIVGRVIPMPAWEEIWKIYQLPHGRKLDFTFLNVKLNVLVAKLRKISQE